MVQVLLNMLLEIKKEIIASRLLNKEVFTLQDFCAYAGISNDHGYKLTCERKINFYRPGGKKIYIDRRDAIAYLMQNPVSSFTTTEQAVNNYFLTSKTAA